MPAITIFSMAINYLRQHLMDALKKQVSDIEQSDVMFVITVPAIWNDASKQFMREAAIAVSPCLAISTATYFLFKHIHACKNNNMFTYNSF